MLDILDIINDATKEANSFENHAAKNLSLEERLLYLQGLALVMNADGEIHPEEKEYIRILIKSFEMDEAILDNFVEFAQRPDKDTVQAFFRTFRRRPIAQLFLFDALMMTRRDDNIDEKEKAVVDKIAEQLEVLKGTYQDIFDLFCHIKNKDWEESALYFSSHLLNPTHFTHLLDYFEVDVDELLTKTEELRRRRISQALKKKINLEKIEWEDLEPEDEESKITSRFVDFSDVIISVSDLIIPKVQSDLDRGDIVINKLSQVERVKDGRVLVDLERLGLKFDYEGKFFTLLVSENIEIKKQQCFTMLCYFVTKNYDDNLNDDIEDIIRFIMQDESIELVSAEAMNNYWVLPNIKEDFQEEIVKFDGQFYRAVSLNNRWIERGTSLELFSRSNMELLTSGKIRLVRKKTNFVELFKTALLSTELD